VRFFGGGARTHSIVTGAKSQFVRFIDTVHSDEQRGQRMPIIRLDR